MLEFARYDEETVALEAGDTVVVFSDGVSEAHEMPPTRNLARRRLLEAIETAGTIDAQGLVDDIVDALRTFTRGAAQNDDITVMVARVPWCRNLTCDAPFAWLAPARSLNCTVGKILAAEPGHDYGRRAGDYRSNLPRIVAV